MAKSLPQRLTMKPIILSIAVVVLCAWSFLIGFIMGCFRMAESNRQDHRIEWERELFERANRN